MHEIAQWLCSKGWSASQANLHNLSHLEFPVQARTIRVKGRNWNNGFGSISLAHIWQNVNGTSGQSEKRETFEFNSIEYDEKVKR